MAGRSLETLFDGEDESIRRLANLIDKGQMLPGSKLSNKLTETSDIECVDGKVYFVVMPPDQPNMKERQGNKGCFKVGCVDVPPIPNQFIAPPGIETLDGNNRVIGNIKLEQLVRG